MSFHNNMSDYHDFNSNEKHESHGPIALPTDIADLKTPSRRNITRFIPSKHSFALVLLTLIAICVGTTLLRHCVPKAAVRVNPHPAKDTKVTLQVDAEWTIIWDTLANCTGYETENSGEGVNRECTIVDPTAKAVEYEGEGNLQLFFYSDAQCTQWTHNIRPSRGCVALYGNDLYWQVI